LAVASPDLLHELMGGFVNTVLSAEADRVCGAAFGTRDPERTKSAQRVSTLPLPRLRRRVK